MSQALYRKWRPRKWDEIVGQAHVVETLKNAVTSGRVAHAYLFAGARGTGKTTAARLLAKAVNCLAEDASTRPCNQCDPCKAVNENRFLDMIEIDAASQTGVDDVRDLREKINFSPSQGKYKIYIIDEVHMFSNSAFNALLKTLEEPPPHAIFILATTEIHKIPPTVLSRCQRHEFRRLPVEVIVKQLEEITRAEKLKAEPEALTLIARQSAGGMRDAISLLDQLASVGRTIDLELAHSVLGTATGLTVLKMVDALAEVDPAAGMDAIHSALDSGTDPRLLARQVVDYLRALLLIQMGNASQVELTGETRTRAEAHAAVLPGSTVLQFIRIFNTAATEARGAWQPALGLELALAEALEVMGGSTASPVKSDPDGGEKPVAKTSRTPSAPAEELKEKVGSADEGVSLAQVQKAWKQVAGALKGNPSLNALLNSCRLLSLKGDTLTLGFASEILRGKVEVPGQLEAIRGAITSVLGVDLKVKCAVSTARQATPPDVREDGMVAAALKQGGEIVDIQG